MNRYALLRLENNANVVMLDHEAINKVEAVIVFNQYLSNVCQLDNDGYAKIGPVTYCVAEYLNHHTV